MTLLAQDTFTRANNASSWGTSSDGKTWVKALGTGTSSIASNKGVLVSSGADTAMELGAGTSASIDARVRFSIGSLNDIAGIAGRFSTTSGGNDYKILWYSSGVHLNKMVAGVNTTLTTASFTVAVNTAYWLRLQISGSTINGKIWADGSAEPGTFTVSTTDTSLAAAGGYGLLANTDTGGSTGVQFDSFSLTDNNAVATATGTLLESDNFVRAATSAAWGTSTGGSVWTNRQGASASLSTNGTVGQIVSSAGTRTHISLGATTYTAQEIVCKITPASTSDDFGVDGRATGDASISGVSGYRFNYVPGTGLVCFRLIGGAGTQIGSTVTKTVAAATAYWFRFRLTGAQPAILVQGRMWADGSTEPGTWDISATDTTTNTALNAGAPGVTGVASSATAIQYAAFTAGDTSSGSTTVTVSITESAAQVEQIAVTALAIQSVSIQESAPQVEQVQAGAAGASASIIEVVTQVEQVNTFAYFNHPITESAAQVEQIRALAIQSVSIQESAPQVEQIAAIAVKSVSIQESAAQVEQSAVKAFTLVIATASERSAQVEQIAVTALTISPGDIQMQASDLAFEYNRIKTRAAGQALQILAITYYGSATNNQNIYGELDAVFQSETIASLHVMRTINDVTAFLKAFEYASNVLADLPLAYYRLGDNVKPYAADATGHNLTGILAGNVLIQQSGGLAMSTATSMLFDGSTGYIAASPVLTVASLQTLSLELWVKFAALPASSASLLGNDSPGSTHSGALLFVNSAGTPGLILGFGGSTSTTVSSSTALAAGTWYHLVATYDGLTMRIYVNGVLRGTQAATGSIAASANGFTLGKNPVSGNYANAYLQEAALYNTVLSQARINTHYIAATNP
jgi:hypothetical protein